MTRQINLTCRAAENEVVGSLGKRNAVTQHLSGLAATKLRYLSYMTKVRKGAGLQLVVRITFQGLFHPPFGVLFTVPSRYYPL